MLCVLACNFVDFRKAFDSISRTDLWKILAWYGLPKKLVDVIQSLYTDCCSAIRINGDISGWFQLTTAVRQGCILSPLLFAIAIDWVMRRVMERSDAGISWMYESKLADLDFADDIALLEESVYSMQHSTSILEE